MFKSPAFARSASVFFSRRHRTHHHAHHANRVAVQSQGPPRTLLSRIPVFAKAAALAVTLTGWLRKFQPFQRSSAPAIEMAGANVSDDVSVTHVVSEPLYPMRNLPPFSYYPILKKETLVAPNTSPDRKTFEVVRLTFAYLSGGLDLDSSTHNIKVIRPGFYKPRSYTPTKATSPGTFDLTIKVYPGGSSEWLAGLPVGTPVGFIGPLPLAIKRPAYAPAERAVVVSLGIGITLGIAAVRKELAAGREVVLIQAVRFQEEALFRDEIEALQRKYGDKLQIKPIASGEQIEGWSHGRVDGKFLNECVGDLPKEDVRFMVVGTKSMIRQVWGMLGTLGYSYRKHALVRK